MDFCSPEKNKWGFTGFTLSDGSSIIICFHYSDLVWALYVENEWRVLKLGITRIVNFIVHRFKTGPYFGARILFQQFLIINLPNLSIYNALFWDC